MVAGPGNLKDVSTLARGNLASSSLSESGFEGIRWSHFLVDRFGEFFKDYSVKLSSLEVEIIQLYLL